MPRFFSSVPGDIGVDYDKLEVFITDIDHPRGYISKCLWEGRDLKAKTFNSVVGKARNSCNLLTVRASSVGIASKLVGDRRVDGLRIDKDSNPRLYGRRYFKRCEREGTIVELDITPLLKRSSAKDLRKLYRCTQDIKHTGVNVLLIHTVKSPLELRKYRDLRTVAEVHGIPRENTDPDPVFKILGLNRDKLAGRYIASDVEVLE